MFRAHVQVLAPAASFQFCDAEGQKSEKSLGLQTVHASRTFFLMATSVQSKVENSPPHTAKLPPIFGASRRIDCAGASSSKSSLHFLLMPLIQLHITAGPQPPSCYSSQVQGVVLAAVRVKAYITAGRTAVRTHDEGFGKPLKHGRQT